MAMTMIVWSTTIPIQVFPYILSILPMLFRDMPPNIFHLVALILEANRTHIILFFFFFLFVGTLDC